MSLHRWSWCAVIGLVSTALADNAIREWGGHDPNDYNINAFDKRVRIYRNTQPNLEWKFEA